MKFLSECNGGVIQGNFRGVSRKLRYLVADHFRSGKSKNNSLRPRCDGSRVGACLIDVEMLFALRRAAANCYWEFRGSQQAKEFNGCVNYD